MRNTKLYSILEQFDKYEQNRCRKFLQSPYFNRSEVIVAIFDQLLIHITLNKEAELSREKLWQTLTLDTVYDDVRFRKYISDLTQLIEDFLCQRVYEKNKLLKATNLIQAVSENKLEKLQGSSMRSTYKIVNEYPYKSAEFYYYQYLIENNYYRLVDYETKRDEKANFDEISSNLDYFFLSEKLRILCGVLSRQNVTAYSYNILIKDETIEYVEKNLEHYHNIPSIAIYYRVYLASIEPEIENHYFSLKQLLNIHSLYFPIDEATQIYTFAQNYCVRKINKGNQKFINELFLLYRELLERKIILVDGMLSPWYFRNIVTIGLRLKETNWTEEFILNYQHALPPEMRKNAVSFNLAQVYFYQKRHEKVIELLRTVEYEDLAYNLDSKALLLATFYELDEIEPLYSLFESFRTYLNRHKDIPAAQRQRYTNLIKFIKKLTNFREGDKELLNKMKQELEHTKNVVSYNWLMEKITELES